MKSISARISQSLSQSMKLRMTALVVVTAVTAFMYSNADAVNVAEPKEQMKEAAEAMEQSISEQKDAAVKEAEEMMNDLDNRIEKVEDWMAQKWDDLKQSSKEQYRETLKSLRKQRNELSEYYGSLKYSSQDAWQEVKGRFEKSYNQLVLSWQKAEAEMKKESGKKSKDK